MSERGISAEDVKTVLENAEKNQTFLVGDDGSFLAKHRLENFCPYVAYEKDGDSYVIKSVYSPQSSAGIRDRGMIKRAAPLFDHSDRDFLKKRARKRY